MMKKSLIILFLLSLSVNAKALPKNFPAEFTYNRKPIDPLCIYEAEESHFSVALNKCGIKSASNRKISGRNNDFIKKGFIGFDYTWSTDKNSNIQSNCYSYYKMLGKIKDFYVLYALNNSGGSGQFSAIYLIRREADAIHIKSIASGDRCNGGINDVKLQGNKIIYNANITASDFLDITKQNPHNINTYDDLSSCAACCIATANFMIDLAQKSENPQIMTVELGDKPIDVGTENQGSYQSCFDSLFTTYQKQGKRLLNAPALQQFVKTFNDTCVKNKV